MNREEFIKTLNHWGREKVPFLFMIDFEEESPVAWPLDQIDSTKMLYDFQGITNTTQVIEKKAVQLEKNPLPFDDYRKKFDAVMAHLNRGDSFLANLTIRSEITLNTTLRELFFWTHAKYKIWYEGRFLCFSPETFVKIKQGRIFSNPMKGTIDASLPEAEKIILQDIKELSEHVTIVDLIRNDLSQVAEHVDVARFRYIDTLKTNYKTLLQVSSEIAGDLKTDQGLGDLLMALLPAGSISGAPKLKTLEIIREVEKEPRGYYTGVAGLFDGENLDSCVLIRFIEKSDGHYYYRSGGGITTQSNVVQEYQEAVDKIYAPVD